MRQSANLTRRVSSYFKRQGPALSCYESTTGRQHLENDSIFLSSNNRASRSSRNSRHSQDRSCADVEEQQSYKASSIEEAEEEDAMFEAAREHIRLNFSEARLQPWGNFQEEATVIAEARSEAKSEFEEDVLESRSNHRG